MSAKTKLTLFVLAVLTGALFCTGSSVWPQPNKASFGTKKALVNPRTFSITTTSKSQLLQRAISRYQILAFPFGDGTDVQATPFKAAVVVSSDSEILKYGIDDSYNLTITPDSVCTINAKTVFGAIYGLETLSQLIDYDQSSNSYSVLLPVNVKDSSRFAWRGLLVDTARHYLKLDTLFRIIDALSFSKMNVLHWHVVDAQSFPAESSSYPDLVKGAWSPFATYSLKNISSVISYALDRGVRVIPEFDVPGHAYSWGIGYPSLTVACPSYESNINNIPLDPTQSFTYDVIHGLFSDMATVFDDQYFHIGGDEVVFGCWEENGNVSKWMKDQGLDSIGTEQYFSAQVHDILANINRIPVSWEEVFENGITQPASAIIQVWKSKEILGDVANAKMFGILSSGWYLDRQIPDPPSIHYEFEDTWKDFYRNDPTNDIGDVPQENLKYIIGGEAAMWGEQVDDSNIQSRVWPRTAAVSERLWSQASVSDTSKALPRLVDFRCRMAQRGISAGPVAPDFCPIP